jgi:hypothetical protein
MCGLFQRAQVALENLRLPVRTIAVRVELWLIEYDPPSPLDALPRFNLDKGCAVWSGSDPACRLRRPGPRREIRILADSDAGTRNPLVGLPLGTSQTKPHEAIMHGANATCRDPGALMPSSGCLSLRIAGIAPPTPSPLRAALKAVRRVSEPSRGEQGGPVDRVHFLPLGLGEPDLGQHPARSGVPLPDRGPQTFVPGRSRPVQNRQRGLGCVSLTPDPA